MSTLDAQDQRIADILGEIDVPEVTESTLSTYLAYLKHNLDLPCQLTGIEDFPWEERYVFGSGREAEYEELKKTQPSYTDTFKGLSLDNFIDLDYGLLIKVRRVSDRKTFVLPLADLKATDLATKHYQLLDDFSVWLVNYR